MQEPSPILISIFIIFINLFLASHNDFKIKIKRKNPLSLLFPSILTLILFTASIFKSATILIIALLFAIHLSFHYMEFHHSIFAPLNIKTLSYTILIINLIALFGLTILYISHIGLLKNGVLEFFSSIFGLNLLLFSRYAFISLASEIAVSKSRAKELGALGVFGNLGIFIMFFIPKRKRRLI